MKLSQKLFIAVVASVGFLTPTLNAQESSPGPGASSSFKLDASSFGLGVAAPTVSVGTSALEKGTFTYRTSVGTSDNFSVGTVSAMGASSSASSTPDYDVTATAAFDVADTSQINQAIGGLQIDSQETTLDGGVSRTVTKFRGRRTVNVEDLADQSGTAETASSGQISGTFEKTFTNAADTKNNVTVDGVGTSTAINLGDAASFNTKISKVGADPTTGQTTGIPTDGSAGTANGSANGSINTSTSASASNSQFVSSFIQAY